jgi:hypothetical protein
LNRPPVNAVDQAMYQEMAALFADVDQAGPMFASWFSVGKVRISVPATTLTSSRR